MTAGADIMDLSAYTGRTADAAEAPLPFLSLEQLRAQAQSMTWVVKHLVPADSIGVLFGASGTFKSFIAIDLALHIAHGLPWMGKKTKQGAVVIVAAEGGSGLWKRIVAWHRERRIPWGKAPVYVVPVAVDLLHDASRVCEASTAAGVTPALVVVDTMSQTFSGEENSAPEVAGYLRELGLQFRMVWQCAVVVVHHTGHQATERPRGSSAIRSNVDFLYGVFRDEKEMLATVECSKQKDGELPAPMSFSMSVVELEHDEDGDAITSLSAKGVGDPLEVLDLMRHEAARGRGGRNQMFLDLAFNGSEEKKVRASFYETVDGDAEAKRQAYFRARKWALNAGLVEFKEGFILRIGA
jgi:hypothetical protein